jgi:Fe2+ or Zn2+ uptake regulation protein
MAKRIKAKHILLAVTLHKSGCSATDARLTILQYFRRQRHPVSVRRIVEHVNSIGTGINQTTVYRTVTAFKLKNIIRQVDLRHNHAHYELANLTDHHHLVCTRCGKIEDVQHCDIENMRSVVLKQSKHFAEIQQHSLEFYGLCKVCIEKN